MTKMERIEKLLEELKYEIEVGIIQGEIDETFNYRFVVPISKTICNGIVFCEFRTRPMKDCHYSLYSIEQRLEIIK